MKRRQIRRIAFLQEYRNRPQTLKELLPEVVKKGYHEVAFGFREGREQQLDELARAAAEHEMGVVVFTGFMKYRQNYLRQRPDQIAVLSRDAEVTDQDQLPIRWGCPFNKGFQRSYFTSLEVMGRIPNVTEVWVNDEAHLGATADAIACYCANCRREWRETFGGEMPKPPFSDLKEKHRLIEWRFQRWNAVHARMKELLNRHHRVLAVFQSSPSPCWDINPWVSGIDFGSMIEGIDGLASDPYYTFHLPQVGGGIFNPIEVYLSETCRFVRGVTLDDEKVGEIVPQGFSHPTFSRPLEERDGWWAGVIPPALGINRIAPYTYLLQRASPMQKAYEEAFRLDAYFERTAPLDFIAVVDSLETQCYDDATAPEGCRNWRLSRMMTLGMMARHHGLPYVYLPSAGLASRQLGRFPVVILPNVSCLSTDARAALKNYVHDGGLLVACGETATRDASGRPIEGSFLEEVFGINACVPENTSSQFRATDGHVAFDDLPWPDEVTASDSWHGNPMPVLGFDHVARLTAAGAEVPAVLVDDDGVSQGEPAVTVNSFGSGHGVFMAGVPDIFFLRREGNYVLNFAQRVLSRLILSLAGDRLPIKARGFPPRVPMQDVRPLDVRWRPTMEFMPCVGDDLYLVTIPSYFREPFTFNVEATLPTGKRCREVRELVSDQPVRSVRQDGGKAVVDVAFTDSDFLKVYAFFLE